MHAIRQPRAFSRSALLFGLLLLAGVGARGPAAKADQDDDAERVPSGAADIYSPIERTFTRQAPLPGGPGRLVPGTSLPAETGVVVLQDLKERLRFADPFFRDTVLAVYLRTHALDRNNSDETQSRAWAGGSAIAVRTGFLDDWLQLEAAAATSQPIWAPQGDGGTLLLTDNQAEVSSPAIANARLRFAGQEIALGRQLVKTPYINPQDNRMLPNTVEGAVLTRRRDEAQTFDYGVGYLWGFKARDSSYFQAFSNELGVVEDRGVLAGGVKAVPIAGLTLGAIDYLIPDVLNTTFAEADWLIAAGPLQFRVSANYTDQRTVGADLIAGAPYETSQVAARAAASYAEVTLLVAGSANGDGAALQGPFGSFPAYTVLDQLNFNEAGETTVVVGAAYDLSHVIFDGLKLATRYGWAWGAVDAPSGAPLSSQREFNFEIEYLPTWGPLKNIHAQIFYSAVELPGNPPSQTRQPQVRGIVTYLIPLL
jgi:hypothetical protein